MKRCPYCFELIPDEAIKCKRCRKFLISEEELKKRLPLIQDKPIIIKNYKGNQNTASGLFQEDSALMSERGYVPISQSWAPGAYGCGSFLFALLLCLILIGFIIFIYMLIVKPEGSLTVTYEQKNGFISEKKIEEKICPKCAEHIKTAAVVCRFCNYEFKEDLKEK